MKIIPSGMAAAHAAPVQRPGLLVEMHFDTVQRWSSRGALNWGGFAWAAMDMQVLGLQVQPFAVAGTLVLGNADDAAGTLVLAQGVQDRLVTIYKFDGAVPTEAVWLATAVGASAQVSPRDVRINLRHRSEFTASPRTYVNQQAGFTHLLPSGTVLRINGIDIRLDRRT
jgi:hypothetical protein